MVCRRCGWPLELSRCGVISKARRLAQPTVSDILSRMSRLLPRRFFALVPIPELQFAKAEREPGRAATLGLGSGLGPWVGARGAPQQSPILRPGRSSLEPSCFHATFCTTRPAIPRPPRASSNRRDLFERGPTCRQAPQCRSVPSHLHGGNGNAPSKTLTHALPARGRAAQPTRVLQRLEHFSETLVLDRKPVTQLRTREHNAIAQDVEDPLLQTTRFGVLGLRDEPPDESSPHSP